MDVVRGREGPLLASEARHSGGGARLSGAHARRVRVRANRTPPAGRDPTGKATSIDIFYRFLELRYRGEIRELTGRLVGSPIDAINRPAHTGASKDRYERSMLPTGSFTGTPEEALDCACGLISGTSVPGASTGDG